MEWQPIETAPKGTHILYFPSAKNARGEKTHGPMYRIDHYPVNYPRKPSHWMPLPQHPQEAKA